MLLTLLAGLENFRIHPSVVNENYSLYTPGLFAMAADGTIYQIPEHLKNCLLSIVNIYLTTKIIVLHINSQIFIADVTVI